MWERVPSGVVGAGVGALVLVCCAAAAGALVLDGSAAARVVVDRLLGRELWEHLHQTAGGRLMRVLEGAMFAACVCLAVLMVLTAVLRCWLGRRAAALHPAHSTASDNTAAEGKEKEKKKSTEKAQRTVGRRVRTGKKVKVKRWPRAYPRRCLALLARVALEQEAARAAHGRDPVCQELRARHAALQALQGECTAAMAQARAALQALVARCAVLDRDVAAALAVRVPEPDPVAEEPGARVRALGQELAASRHECAALGARLDAAAGERQRLQAQLAAQLDEMTQLSNAVTRLQQRNAQLAGRLQQQQQRPWCCPEGPSLPLFSSTPTSAAAAAAAVGPPGDDDDGGYDDDDDDRGPAGYYPPDLESVPRLF